MYNFNALHVRAQPRLKWMWGHDLTYENTYSFDRMRRTGKWKLSAQDEVDGVARFFAKVRKVRPHILCLNDDFPEDSAGPRFRAQSAVMEAYLNDIAPDPAPFEDETGCPTDQA